MKPIQSVALFVICMVSAVAVQGQSGMEILEATGIQGGMIVHLGVGDGELTAGLSLSPAYVVAWVLSLALTQFGSACCSCY